MLIPLKLVRDQPLQQQLYQQLRELIGSARLASGMRMPSTRMLADQFSISRITVILTYERLIAEGLLTTVPAKGTFVRRTLGGAPVGGQSRGDQAPDGHQVDGKHVAGQAPAVRAIPSAHGRITAPASSDRPVGRPDPRLFPTGRWRAVMRTALDGLGASLAADHPDGDPALRLAIAHWLSASRGLAVRPDQIVLSSGRQHALHVAVHLLLRPGVRVVIEAPCDRRSEQLIASSGATLVRIHADSAGLRTDLLPDGPVAMILVTPEHQRPLGAVMIPQRRQALLAWAERSGATVIAEDVDGELRYDAMDAAPLMGLDPDRVVHLGGFALSLGPGVQLGYLVLPRRLIAAARTVSRLIDDHAGQLEAAALAAFLDSGGYVRHLHHLRKIYLGRRDVLIHGLRRHFGFDTPIDGETGGLHLVWHPTPRLGPADAIAGLASRHGLDAAPLGDSMVLIGFGVPAEPQIETAVSGLAVSLAQAAESLAARSGGEPSAAAGA